LSDRDHKISNSIFGSTETSFPQQVPTVKCVLSGPCVTADNSLLYGLAHKSQLYAKSDIDGLSGLAHSVGMSDLARDPKQIGNLIRRARKKRALSQMALGDKAGLRQETISLIENGNPSAKIETLLAVLSALDLEFQIASRSKAGRGTRGYL
jgi:HTH-type transcriptional regulator/antitoxin HipB